MEAKVLSALAALAVAGCAGDHGPRGAAFVATSTVQAVERPDGAIAARPMPSAPVDASRTPRRIIFASCAQQNEDQSIWNVIADDAPDLVLYMGDNVYGDVRSNDAALPELKAAYMRLAMSEPFARLRKAAPVIAVWDDHDFGVNDGGGDYPLKDKTETLFEYVWDVRDERAARPGVYGAWILGETGRRVQIIMLDTRFFRSPLKPTDEMGAHGKERYLPDDDPAKTMLGEAQWSWLEQELRKPAELRLLVSSIQVLSEGHGYEAWREFPRERQKLFDAIKRAGARGVLILSGDRHAAALYERDDLVGYPLFEATSSSLNLPASKWRAASGDTWVEIDPNRKGDMFFDANYGRLDIDWSGGSDGGGVVLVKIIDQGGRAVLSEEISLSRIGGEAK